MPPAWTTFSPSATLALPARNAATPARSMASNQKSPGGQQWLQDFRSLLGLSPVSRDAIQGLVYLRYPDAGWADEYVATLWSAYRYFITNKSEWERLGLIVFGKNQAIVKDCLLLALYVPFLKADRADLVNPVFPPRKWRKWHLNWSEDSPERHETSGFLAYMT